MAEISKLEHRKMGEYSIAKSFKGILRIAHIKDMGDNTNEYAIDEFLNPTFYGTPSELMDISGKESETTSASYANAIKALSGGLKRYNRFTLDKLRLNRVPVTDSMGNYLNWNVGFDGVTIGSNESINGYDPSTIELNKVTFQKLFPVFKTNNITVGMKKMLLGTAKGGVNNSRVELEGTSQTPMLVVQNFYDKSDVNKDYIIETDDETTEKIKFFKYKETPQNEFSEFRTIYTNTKDIVEDYDVLMYNQDNFDIINGIHHAKVDVVNLKKYVKKMIDKFMRGNVIEVPSGAVIWQYCSLDKWRAETENVEGNSINLEGGAGFPGHRPSMEMRENHNSESSNPFYNTLIQGACRKQTYLSGPTQLATNKEVINDNTDMSIKEKDQTLLSEIIPLYKRDYVLCDGSVYRIPYLPKGFSSNLSELMRHRNRFFELFFNLGYKYTSRDKMISRHVSKMNSKSDGTYYLTNTSDNMITDEKIMDTDYIKDDNSMTSHKSFTKLTSGRKNNMWSGTGTPKFVPVTDQIFNNCDDLDVLFQEDLATMLCCDEIYRFVREKEKINLTTPTRDEIIDHLKNTKLPEEYIFNSYIGDTDTSIASYNLNSVTGNKVNKVIEVTYHGATGLTGSDSKPTLLLGREVTNFNSLMKFYDTTKKTYTNIRVYELPLVTYFIQLITSTKGIDGALVPFLYTFFNYDFQVPHFIANDRTPVFIGSGAYLYSNNYLKNRNEVQSWSCNYDCNFIPHRHYIAISKYKQQNETSQTQPYIYHPYNQRPIWGSQDSPYYTTNELTETNSVLAEVCKGKVHQATGNKHGWGYTVTDNTESYILRENELTLETQYRNGMPVLIAQSNYDIPDTTTGENYSQYENFTESDGGYKEYYNEHKDKWFTFTMGEDDPRFENAEPNRGISSMKTGEINNFNDQKTAMNLTNWPKSTSNTFFSMENITMLPLIKL